MWRGGVEHQTPFPTWPGGVKPSSSCLLANTITTSTLENEHTQLIFKGGCSLSPPRSTTTSSWPTPHPPLKTSRRALFQGWLLFAHTITSTTLKNKHVCLFSGAAYPPFHLHPWKRARMLVFEGCLPSLPLPLSLRYDEELSLSSCVPFSY